MSGEHGTDRADRPAKKVLTPLQKYEIWLQLVRQEVTMAEAADQHRVDRAAIVRIRTVAREGALAALADSRPRRAGPGSETWSETDRSHRKLAHRGSYLNRLWVCPSSVRAG